MKRFAVVFLSLVLLSAMPASAQRKVQTEYVENAYQALKYWGDEAKAMAFLDEQLKLFPKDADALFLRAILNNKHRDNKQALEDITLAAKYNKKGSRQNEAMIYWWKAAIQNELGESEASLASLGTAYELAAKKYPENYREIALSYASRLSDNGELAGGSAIYEIILGIYPEDKQAHLGLVRNLVERGELAQGLELLGKLKLEDSPADVCRQAMVLYGKTKEDYRATDAAIEYLKKAGTGAMEEITPYLLVTYDYSVAKLKTLANNTNDRSKLDAFIALLHFKSEHYSRAIDVLTALDGKGVLDYEMRSVLAESYASLGQYKEALEAITLCLDTIPNSTLYNNRASYYRALGENEKALSDCEAAIELTPEEPYFHYAKGMTLELLDNTEEALESYNVSINIDPGVRYAYPRLARGRLLMAMGDTAAATRDLIFVICYDLEVSDNSCRQYAYLLNGETEAALNWMKKILEKYPKSAVAYYDMACIQSYLGNKDEALEALKKSIELGNRNFVKMRSEKMFEPLREDDAFKLMLEK